MKKLGFSLMEMMIVLLIVSVVIACSAPMVNQKLSKTEAGSPWVFTDANGSSAYNMTGNEAITSLIGTTTLPANVPAIAGARQYIQADNNPQIALGGAGNTRMGLTVKNDSVFLTDNDVSANIASNAIAIKGTVSSDNTIAIKGTAGGNNAIAIGDGAVANAENSIAIGNGAKVNASHSVTSRGGTTNYPNTNSVAIGPGVEVNGDNIIVIGTSEHNVVIDGSLYVHGNIVVGNRAQALSCESGGISARDMIISSSDIKAKSFTTQSSSSLSRPSDRRLKDVGEAFTAGLEEIKKLELFNYTYKKDKSKTPQVGVMAQDLQKIFPNSVREGEDGFLRIRWDEMFYATINAIKDLDKKIETHVCEFLTLQKEVKELRNELDTLRKENKELKEENKEFKKDLKEIKKLLKNQ